MNANIGEFAIGSSWQKVKGDGLAFRWSKVGQRVQYNPEWMQENSESSYVPPIVDFASHSPFAGVFWFAIPRR
jgi:hypothetical protein